MTSVYEGGDIYAYLAGLDRSQDMASLILSSSFFDAAWYRARYMDGIDGEPIDHYVRVGMGANHDPSLKFSSEQYYDHYPDIRAAGVSAFHHFVMSGAVERRLYFPFSEGSYDDILAGLPDLSDIADLSSRARIAVVAHVYYPDLWEELQSQIAVISEPFDLYVSLVHGKSDGILEDVKTEYPDAIVKIFPNHGRDVLSFTEFLNIGAFDDYELLCKLHTKKSLHRDDGAFWRNALYNALLGSPANVERICERFRTDPSLGIFVPDGHVETYMGMNERLVRRLLDRIDIPLEVSTITFPSGNMFWMSGACIALLKALDIQYTEYPFEAGQLDATIGHAFERVIGAVCTHLNKRILTTSDIAAT